MTEPDLAAPDPRWTPLVPPWDALGTRSFVYDADPERLRVAYYQDEDGAFAARVWFGPGAEGPPGHAHGGAQAAVLDEVMGTALFFAGHVVVASDIQVGFRQMVPLGRVLTVRSRVGVAGKRRVAVEAWLEAPEETRLAESSGQFARLRPEHVAALQATAGGA